MSISFLHRAIDHLAMWSEDRVPREPQAYRPGPDGPLSCFGPLGPLPDPPAGSASWRAASPGRPGDRMSLHCTRTSGSRRGTILLVPPWKIARPSLVSGYTGLLASSGYEVWLVVPPHHIDRVVPGERPGEGFVGPDLGRMRSLFEQLVLEIRLSAALAQGHGPVGLVGLSLGGLAAAFAATGPEPIDFAALVAPPADLSAVLAETRIGRRYQELARRAGAPLPSLEVLQPALAALIPGRRVPTARRLFIAAGLHDQIARAGPLALARAWGVEPALYPRGHIGLLFFCRALRRDLARFVTDS